MRRVDEGGVFMKTVQDIVDLASAFYGSAVLFSAIDCDLFGQVERGELDARPRGVRLLADACVAEGLLVKEAEGRKYRQWRSGNGSHLLPRLLLWHRKVISQDSFVRHHWN